MNKAGQRGFTLVELMIVVAILAILVGIAFPSYQDQMRKTRRADAQAALMGLSNAMERWFTERNTYKGAAAGGANMGAPTIYATKSPVDGAQVFYNLTISAARTTTYTVAATPVGDQASDGLLDLTSTGRRGWDKGGNGNTQDVGEDCWETTC